MMYTGCGKSKHRRSPRSISKLLQDSSAQCPMSLKFGAKRDTWATLLDIIQELVHGYLR